MSDRASRALLPVLFLLVVAGGLVTLVLLVGRDPVIESVNPRVIRDGATVEISGRFFGDQIESLFVAGRRIPASSILSWEGNSIRFRAGDDLQSGLLAVETERGRSDGVLVQVGGRVPGAAATGEKSPEIRAISSEELTIGTVVTITGGNFGALRRDSSVIFTKLTGDECSACEQQLFYGRWTDSVIEVRVPDGAVDGGLRVRTPDGVSNAARYTVTYSAGRVDAVDRIEIGLRYEALLDQVVFSDDGDGTSSADRTVVLRVPHPVLSPLQRRAQYLNQNQPDYTFEGVSEGFSQAVIRTALVERYAARTRLLAPNLPLDYERTTPFVAFYTRDLPGLDLSAENVSSLAAAIPVRSRSPAAIAESAYDLTLSRLTPVLGEARSAAEALESGFADHQGYANLMVGLLRATGVPARVVSGVIITPDRRTYAHAWVEFFVTSVGWIPADPYLGDGAFLATLAETEDPAVFYFGNLDAMRVAFTRGLDSYDPRVLTGTDLRPQEPFSQQLLFARTGRAIDSADLVLGVPRAIGVLRLD